MNVLQNILGIYMYWIIKLKDDLQNKVSVLFNEILWSLQEKFWNNKDFFPKIHICDEIFGKVLINGFSLSMTWFILVLLLPSLKKHTDMQVKGKHYNCILAE